MEPSNKKRVPHLIGETFQAVRANGKKSMVVLLFVLGPFLLLQAVSEFMSGKSLFTAETEQMSWLTQLTNIVQGGENVPGEPEDMWGNVIDFFSLFFYPFVYASIILFVSGWHNGKNPEMKEVRKQAQQKYGSSLGALIIFTVMWSGILLIYLLFLMTQPVFSGWTAELLTAIIYFSVIGLLLSKISLFLGHVVLAENSQGLGFGVSWKFTRGRTGYVFGFYILLILIGTAVYFFFQLLVSSLLGNSVIAGLVINLIGLLLILFYTAGYTVLYKEITKQETEDHYLESHG